MSDTLAALMEACQKKHGSGCFTRGSDSRILSIPRISTGIFVLDYALSGGIPVGRISMVYGKRGAGKSSLLARIAATAQGMCRKCYGRLLFEERKVKRTVKKVDEKGEIVEEGVEVAKLVPIDCVNRCRVQAEDGKKKEPPGGMNVVWVDSEGCFDDRFYAKLGVDNEARYLVVPDYAEQAIDIADAAIRTGECDLLIVDTIAHLTPKKEREVSSEEWQMGLQARLCIAEGTPGVLADGEVKEIQEFEPGDVVKAFDVDSGRIIRRSVLDAWCAGIREVISLNHHLRVTPDHPVLTPSGWRKAGDLAVGDRIARTRRVPFDFGEDVPNARLLGYLLGDGGFRTYGAGSFTNSRDEIVRDFESRLAPFDCKLTETRQGNFRISAVNGAAVKVPDSCPPDIRPGECWCGCGQKTKLAPRSRSEAGWVAGEPLRYVHTHQFVGRRNKLRSWLDSLGFREEKARSKFIPSIFFKASRESILELLTGLWLTDGWVVETGRVGYTSTSVVLIYQIEELLLRFGIPSDISYAPETDSWRLCLGGARVRSFASLLLERFIGYKRDQLLEAARRAEGGCCDSDWLPDEVIPVIKQNFKASEVREILGHVRLSYPEWNKPGRIRLDRRDVGKLLDYRDVPELRKWVDSDVWWERITSIDRDECRVWDVEIEGAHNLEIGRVIVHNCNKAMRVWTSSLNERQAKGQQDCTIVLANQIRMKVGLFPVETRPGGMGQEFATSVDIRLKQKGFQFDTEGRALSQTTEFVVEKNKTGAPKMSGVYQMCLTPHKGRECGDTWDDVSVYEWGKRMGLITGRKELSLFGRKYDSEEKLLEVLGKKGELFHVLRARLLDLLVNRPSDGEVRKRGDKDGD